LDEWLEMVAADLQPRTIFFGGGTPSILAKPITQNIRLAAIDAFTEDAKLYMPQPVWYWPVQFKYHR